MTNDNAPTTCDGRRCSNGNANPVALVNAVVARNALFHRLNHRRIRRPTRTTMPVAIPAKLSATCTAVSVDMSTPFESVVVTDCGAATAPSARRMPPPVSATDDGSSRSLPLGDGALLVCLLLLLRLELRVWRIRRQCLQVVLILGKHRLLPAFRGLERNALGRKLIVVVRRVERQPHRHIAFRGWHLVVHRTRIGIHVAL